MGEDSSDGDSITYSGGIMKPETRSDPVFGECLHEEVPTDVLEFLRGLPDNADDMPARWRH